MLGIHVCSAVDAHLVSSIHPIAKISVGNRTSMMHLAFKCLISQVHLSNVELAQSLLKLVYEHPGLYLVHQLLRTYLDVNI